MQQAKNKNSKLERIVFGVAVQRICVLLILNMTTPTPIIINEIQKI